MRKKQRAENRGDSKETKCFPVLPRPAGGRESPEALKVRKGRMEQEIPGTPGMTGISPGCS